MTRITLCAVALTLMSGCPGRPCPTYPFNDATSALESYRDMRRPARVLRAEARVDRRDPEGRIRGTVLMFIARPDRVRFDAMTQFGPAAVLTSDGDRFALMDLRENRFYEGPTCPANIERLLGLRFSSTEVTRLLLGETPRIEAEERRIRCEGGSYHVELLAEDGRRQELVLEVRDQDLTAPPESQRMRLKRSEVFSADGQTEWRVTYDDYAFIADPDDEAGRGVVLPFRVRFEDPSRDIDTLVRFSRIDLNVEIPAGAFRQETRPGLEVHAVSCD